MALQFINSLYFIWAWKQENLSSGFANNKGADQHSQISAFAFHFLKSIISTLTTNKILIF